MIHAEVSEPDTRIFEPNSWWPGICLFITFLLATLIRLDEIKAPGYSITREYNSAIVARALYFEGNEDIPLWRRDIASDSHKQITFLEPPLTEYLVALIYRFLGNDEIWYARYLTSLFWLIGAVFLYQTTRILISSDAALFAASYYLFVPIGIKVSRSFQPDSLMMMMFLISLYAIVTHFEKPSWRRVGIAGIATGITLLLRPLVIFILFGAFIALTIYKRERWLDAFDRYFVVFSFLSLVFPLLFYGYGIFVAGFLEGQADLSFRPYLLTRLKFWQQWFEVAVEMIGHTAVITALLGFSLVRKSLAQALLIGLAVGYFLFGLVFNYHIATHPYYQIQALPLIGIAAAPFLVHILTTLKKVIGRYFWVPVVPLVLFGLYFSYKDVRTSLYVAVFEPPKIARQIGEIVVHSPHVVTVGYAYGLPLRYYGELSGTYWREKIEDELYRHPGDHELSVAERLKSLDFRPEYFVITNFELYRRHQDLKAYLERDCTLLAEEEQYLIYSSCRAIEPMDE